jgi:hypothetical protein
MKVIAKAEKQPQKKESGIPLLLLENGIEM